MKKIYALMLLMLFVSCSDNNDCCVFLDSENYFPLAVGNYWIMKSVLDAPEGPHYMTTHVIDKKESIDGKSYYRMITGRGIEGREQYYDTAYYRMDHRQYVFERKRTTEEQNIFRFAAEKGDSWDFETGRMTLSNIGPYEFIRDARLVDDTRTFDFDQGAWVDGQSSIILAPNIGYLAIWGAWSRMELSEASINGHVHKFE